jgi:hypothetical protein
MSIEHAVELLASGHRIGYLKSRITDVTDFIETIESIARRLWVTEGTVENTCGAS